jgi:hypothetical protein
MLMKLMHGLGGCELRPALAHGRGGWANTTASTGPGGGSGKVGDGTKCRSSASTANLLLRNRRTARCALRFHAIFNIGHSPGS